MNVPGLIIILTTLLLAGCGKKEIVVYQIPKEEPPGGTVKIEKTTAKITWSAPTEWKEQPLTQMRQGSFLVTGKNGETADMSVVTFPGDAGGDLANINRWRGQINLPPIAEPDLKKLIQPLDLNGSTVKVIEMENSSVQSQKPSRILAAILFQSDQTWFFKLTGPDELVAEQKTAFLEFLKSIQFADK